MRPAAAIACLVAAAAMAVPGCDSAPIKVPEDPASITGGLGLRLWYARPGTRQYEYFTVDPDGTLGYGGGMKAFDREVDWRGPLTKDEAAGLRQVVDAAHWLDGAAPGREGKETTVAEVSVRAGNAERSFTINGPDDAVSRIVELLSKAAQRRFDRYMQRLPDAGVQRR